MIGTSIGVYMPGNKNIDTSMLLKEPWHKLNNIIEDKNATIAYSYYDSYSIKDWIIDDNVFIFEGLIYNMEFSDIKRKLNLLALDNKHSNIKEAIDSFINEADGDYVVTIYNKKNKRLIIFNDILGGLAIHYSYSENHILLSRSLSYVICNEGKMDLSPQKLSEFVTFGYNVGDHTIFNNIKKLTPATCLIVSYDNSKLKVDVFQVIEPSFATDKQFKSKDEAVTVLKDIFLESCKRRVQYAIKNDYTIVNTMSGGFDSRTILGGIEKNIENKNYTNITYEYKQDESEVAKKVLNKIGSSSKYVKLSFQNNPILDDSKLSFKTDGKIPIYTNSVCYNDMQFCIGNYLHDKKVLYFGGFGGEYIRHPYKAFLQSPKQWGLSFTPSVKLISGIFNCTPDNVLTSLNNVAKDHFNDGNEAVAKFYYNEYYQNLVRCSGEERTRMFFNTVQPMMSKDFILTIRNRVPLKWVGFNFYASFLKKIDPRLLEVELYNSVDIKSKKALFLEDFKHNWSIVSYIRYLLRKYTRYEYNNKPNSIDFRLIEKFYNRLSDKSIIDFTYLKSVYDVIGRAAQLRVLTILEFIYECEAYLKKDRKIII